MIWFVAIFLFWLVTVLVTMPINFSLAGRRTSDRLECPTTKDECFALSLFPIVNIFYAIWQAIDYFSSKEEYDLNEALYREKYKSTLDYKRDRIQEEKNARIKRLEQAAERAQRDLEIAMKSGPAWDDRLKA